MSGGRQKQMGVALPGDLRAKLDAAAAESGISLAEEIRRRLERSFTQDADEKTQDPKTRELANDVMWLADAITYQVRHEGDRPRAWHSNATTHVALAEALRTWLDIISPPVGLLGHSDLPVGLLGRSDPPTLGRATARHLQWLKTALQLSGGGVNALGLLSPDLERMKAALELSGGVLPGLPSPERNKEKKS
jgi:hypothetical protein